MKLGFTLETCTPVSVLAPASVMFVPAVDCRGLMTRYIGSGALAFTFVMLMFVQPTVAGDRGPPKFVGIAQIPGDVLVPMFGFTLMLAVMYGPAGPMSICTCSPCTADVSTTVAATVADLLMATRPPGGDL
jgi:hypothetical protein